MRVPEIAALVWLVVGCTSERSAGSACADGVCAEGLACERGVCRVPSDASTTPDARLADDASRRDPDDAAMSSEASADAPEPRDAHIPWDVRLAPPPDDPPPDDSGPIDPSPSPRTCVLDGAASDVAFDWERHRVVSVHADAGRVTWVELADCTQTQVVLEGRPSASFFDAFRDEVLVGAAIPATDPSSGRLDVVDARSREVLTTHSIAFAPRSVVADGRGHAWVGARDVLYWMDLTTGDTTPVARVESTDLSLHPARDRVYFEYADQIARVGESEGSYRAVRTGARCRIRAHPSGTSIVSTCGVFLASNSSLDLVRIGSFDLPWIDLAFERSGARMFSLDGRDELAVHDATTFALLASVPLSRTPRRVFVGPDYVVLLYDETAPARTTLEVRALATL